MYHSHQKHGHNAYLCAPKDVTGRKKKRIFALQNNKSEEVLTIIGHSTLTKAYFQCVRLI